MSVTEADDAWLKALDELLYQLKGTTSEPAKILGCRLRLFVNEWKLGSDRHMFASRRISVESGMTPKEAVDLLLSDDSSRLDKAKALLRMDGSDPNLASDEELQAKLAQVDEALDSGL